MAHNYHQHKNRNKNRHPNSHRNHDTPNLIYTRNLDPLYEGHKLGSIVLYDANEEEIDLHMIKQLKLCFSIPSLKDNMYIDDSKKIDVLLKEQDTIQGFLISNEPVFTQSRLSKSLQLTKMQILSDFKKREYARSTGTYIYELSALTKAIFIIDRNDKVLYVKYYDDLHAPIDSKEIQEAIEKAISY